MAFVRVKVTRSGSPRARTEVRAKVSHTSHQGRRIELFVTGPVAERLRWTAGARVETDIGVGPDARLLRLTPSHAGVKLMVASKRSETLRLCVSGDFLRPSICAPVRILPHHREGSVLFVELPPEWLIDGFAAESSADAA